MRAALLTPLIFLMAFVALAATLDQGLLKACRNDPQPLTEEESAQVVDTVHLFNKILQDFYASGGEPAMLDEMPATKTQRHLIYRDLGYLGDAGVVLVYDLADLEVLEISSPAPETVEVRVREQWNYVYQSAADRKPVSELVGMTLDLDYALGRSDGRWLVTGWDPVLRPQLGDAP